MKHKRLLIAVGIVAAIALVGGGIALGGFLFQKTLTGTVNIVPNGDIVVTADLALGTVTTGDNVTKSVTVQNNSQSPVLIAAGNLLGPDSSVVATVAWPLIGQTIAAGGQSTANATFTVSDNQTMWNHINVSWVVSGTTP